MRKCKSWMDPAHSHDADWPPHQSLTIMDLVADARAVDWDFTTWCYATGHDAADARRPSHVRVLAGLRQQTRGPRRLELIGTSLGGGGVSSI